MTKNSFRCRYTAEAAYDMLNEDSDASKPEEEVQEYIATVPTSVEEPPRNQCLIVILPPLTIHQVMSSNHSCTQVPMVCLGLLFILQE